MEFELTREQEMIQNAVRDFVTKEFANDVVRELDEIGEFPEKYLKKLSDLGFLGMTVPEEFGGEGEDIVGASIVTQELARTYPALAACYSGVVFNGGAVINALGTAEQKEKYLSGLSLGKFNVSLALTESDDDPDGDMISTEAEAFEEGFLISGIKNYIGLGDVANLFIVLAKTGKDSALSIFCIDAENQGITLSPVETIGNKGEKFFNVKFENVRVDKNNLLGGSGNGKEQLELIQNLNLLGVAAQAVGIAQGAFDYSLNYAKTRVQFDQIIGKFTAIKEKLTDLICRIDGARLLVFQAAQLASKSKHFSREAATAKSVASGAAVQASMDGLQIYGGYGYSMEYDIQRYVRDAAGTLSAGISNEYLSEKIGRCVGL